MAAAVSSSSSGKSLALPWIEKYRPRLLEDVVGNEDIVLSLKALVRDGNMPNLLLCGPPGIGKTTSVWCMAEAMLGAATLSEAVLELNASDERGIDVVRSRIKAFAQKQVTLPPRVHKIVILDEADSMTQGAQQALRRIMETYSSSTRFALACNISSKLIEPIQSRCAVLRFQAPSPSQMLTRLTYIAKAEELQVDPDAYDALLFVADGDLRLAVNQLQAAATAATVLDVPTLAHENAKTARYIDAAAVYRVCDQPHPHTVASILQFCNSGKVDEACDLLAVLYREGYSALDIVTTMFRVTRNAQSEETHESKTLSNGKRQNTIKTRLVISENQKVEYAKIIAEAHMHVLEGVGSLLQLSGMIAKMCLLAL